jgi:hypothetical protein
MDLSQKLSADDIWAYVCSLTERVISDFEKAHEGEQLSYESRLNLQNLITFYNEMERLTNDISEYDNTSNWFRLSRIARNEMVIDEYSFESSMINVAEMFQEFKLLIPRYMLKSTTKRLSVKLNNNEENAEEDYSEDEVA